MHPFAKCFGAENSAFGGAVAIVAAIKVSFSRYTFSFRRYINKMMKMMKTKLLISITIYLT